MSSILVMVQNVKQRKLGYTSESLCHVQEYSRQLCFEIKTPCKLRTRSLLTAEVNRAVLVPALSVLEADKVAHVDITLILVHRVLSTFRARS